jgi:cell division topological specificity factor
MSLFDYFRGKPQTSASVAKERLQVVIAHERSQRGGPDYLPMLKQDLLEVIRKYVPISEEDVSVQFDHQGNCDVLELNVTLPDR